MPNVARVGDITIGFGSHGYLECPHALIGIWITGSSNVLVNDRPVVRVGDIGVHFCPHCGINLAIVGASRTLVNDRPVHRVGDVELEMCGIGITITGSPNTIPCS